jgi:hypothetical protein
MASGDFIRRCPKSQVQYFTAKGSGMPNIYEIFKRRHCGREMIALCVVCVGIPVQTQPSGSRGNDSRVRESSGARDAHARDQACRSGIRKAWEPFRAPRWGLLAGRPNQLQDQGPVDRSPRMRARKAIADVRSPVHSDLRGYARQETPCQPRIRRDPRSRTMIPAFGRASDGGSLPKNGALASPRRSTAGLGPKSERNEWRAS